MAEDNTSSSIELNAGIDQLNARRARKARQAPQPRHPKLSPQSALATQADPADDGGGEEHQVPAENARQPSADPGGEVAPNAGSADSNPGPAESPTTPERAEQTPAPTAPRADLDTGTETRSRPQPSGGFPKLDIDPTDPTAHMVSPTVLSIPASIVKRFERARTTAPSHTALVLDALRAHAQELPTLILDRRPGLNPGDLFPFREAPGRTTTDTPLPVRIRPTKGELAVMKKLSDWASARIAEQRPGQRETNRSEMVAAALDAFLPKQRSK